jgi:sulfofructose kinase
MSETHASSAAPFVFCVGNAVLDYVFRLDHFPRRAEKYRANALAVVGGGVAANAAVTVARLGGKSALAARIGADIPAQIIDHKWVRQCAGHTSTVSSVYIDANGERQIVSYSDASLPRVPDHLPTIMPEHVTVVLGDTRWDEGTVHLFRLAAARNIPRVLDGDRAPLLPEVLSLASHIAFSVQGLREVTGISDPREALTAYAQKTSAWIAVTMGEEGVLFTAPRSPHTQSSVEILLQHSPAFTVDVVDTLGAGDVWHGAFALALAEQAPIETAVRFASAVAALKCTRFGGRNGIPTRHEVDAFLQDRIQKASFS